MFCLLHLYSDFFFDCRNKFVFVLYKTASDSEGSACYADGIKKTCRNTRDRIDGKIFFVSEKGFAVNEGVINIESCFVCVYSRDCSEERKHKSYNTKSNTCFGFYNREGTKGKQKTCKCHCPHGDPCGFGIEICAYFAVSVIQIPSSFSTKHNCILPQIVRFVK